MLLDSYKRYFEKNYILKIIKQETIDNNQYIQSGHLISRVNGKSVDIVNFIPRFCNQNNYTNSFGIQWNKFAKTQLDSYMKKDLSASRLWYCSKWNPDEMQGKNILEIGSGAGRFTEVLLHIPDLDIVSFDYSNAVEANHENNKNNRLTLFQGNLYDIPLEEESFDYVVCYGVLQHTPEPEKAFDTILRFLKPEGLFSVDIYRKHILPYCYYHPKYLWRPITKRIKSETLFNLLKFYLPLWLPIDTLIKKIPKFGLMIAGLIPIPCWNYFTYELSKKEYLDWALMNTFDALSPEYDSPKSRKEVIRWCQKEFIEDYEVFYGGNGVIANGRKKSTG